MAPQHIIVTGASSGLGAALARSYAAPGIVLGLIGRHAERLEDTAQRCRQSGATVLTGVLDVTDAAAMERWLLDFDGRYPVDLAIANAGISAGTGGGDESAAQARQIFNVNVNGVIHTVTPLLARMKTRRQGQIAMVSSIAGFRGSPAAPAYSASKAAVRYYAQALRGQFSPHGVQISVICPGFIRTPMTDVNPFPMPFMIDAERAAGIIRRGLARGKAKIIFPWPMALLARLQNLLPDVWMDRIYRAVPAKPVE